MAKHRGPAPVEGRRDHTGWWVMGVALLLSVVCLVVGFMSCMGFLLS